MSALATAYEKAEHRFVADKNAIPPITDPMGKYWRQPDRHAILLDDTHAIMPQHVFDSLSEYNCSMPTGVYPGKMWKCHVGSYDSRVKVEDRYWQLRWFGVHPTELESLVTNNARTILIA